MRVELMLVDDVSMVKAWHFNIHNNYKIRL